MKKFKVGQGYVWTDWFSGGRTHYTVSSREGNKLVLSCIACELDGVHERTETFDILMDEEGNERVLMCEYRDHRGFLFANSPMSQEEIEEKVSELLSNLDFTNWKYPWMAQIVQLALEYLSLEGLEDALRASQIPEEILSVCKKTLSE